MPRKYKVTLTYEIETPARFRPEIDRLVFQGVDGVLVALGRSMTGVVVRDGTVRVVPVKDPEGGTL